MLRDYSEYETYRDREQKREEEALKVEALRQFYERERRPEGQRVAWQILRFLGKMLLIALAWAIFAILWLSLPAHGQEKPLESRSAASKAQVDLPAHPQPRSPISADGFKRVWPRRPSPHPFYDRFAKIELAGTGSLAMWDMAQTCHGLANGNREVGLPTQSCAGVVGLTLSFYAASEGLSYIFHRTGHHKLERLPRLYLAFGNAHGIAASGHR